MNKPFAPALHIIVPCMNFGGVSVTSQNIAIGLENKGMSIHYISILKPHAEANRLSNITRLANFMAPLRIRRL